MTALDMTTERAFANVTRNNNNNATVAWNNSRSVSNSSLVLPPIAKSPLVAHDKLVQGEAETMKINGNHIYNDNNFNSDMDGEEVPLPPHYGQSRRLLQRLREGSECGSNSWCKKDDLSSHHYHKSRANSINTNSNSSNNNFRSAHNSHRMPKAENDRQSGTSTSRCRAKHYSQEEYNSENANNVYE